MSSVHTAIARTRPSNRSTSSTCRPSPTTLPERDCQARGKPSRTPRDEPRPRHPAWVSVTVATLVAALVGVQDLPGDRVPPAADRDRHGQRGVGQRGVGMLAQGEPDHAAGGHVQHAVEEQLALPGGDLGAISVPLAVGCLRLEMSV